MFWVRQKAVSLFLNDGGRGTVMHTRVPKLILGKWYIFVVKYKAKGSSVEIETEVKTDVY